MLQVALEAPLGHSGLTSTVLDSFELSEPPAPAAVRRIISLGGRRQRAAFLQSLSPPARARAEAGGGADGERRRVLRGLGSVGSVGSKSRHRPARLGRSLCEARGGGSCGSPPPPPGARSRRHRRLGGRRHLPRWHLLSTGRSVREPTTHKLCTCGSPAQACRCARSSRWRRVLRGGAAALGFLYMYSPLNIL